jgi:fucose permease
VSWQKREAFLGKVQAGSIGLYLACLGGYTIPPVARAFGRLQDAAGMKVVEVAGLVCFCLFVAATLLVETSKTSAPDDHGQADSRPDTPGRPQ